MHYKLNNGEEVKFKGLDEWSRPIMEYIKNGVKHTILIVDNVMHSQTNGEPDYPLSSDMQLRDYDFNFSTGEFVKKENVSDDGEISLDDYTPPAQNPDAPELSPEQREKEFERITEEDAENEFNRMQGFLEVVEVIAKREGIFGLIFTMEVIAHELKRRATKNDYHNMLQAIMTIIPYAKEDIVASANKLDDDYDDEELPEESK